MSVATNGFEYVSLGIHPLRDPLACLIALSETRYSLDGTDMYPINPPIISFVPADGLGYEFYSPRDEYRCLFKTFKNNTIGDPIYANSLKAITFGDKSLGSALINYTFGDYFNDAPFLPLPYQVTGNSNNLQGYNTFHRVSFTAEYFRSVPLATLNTNHPNYRSLVAGYSLDSRTIPSFPVIVPYADTAITIKYYQNNHLEPIPGLESIGWRVYKVDLKAGISQVLPIDNCVLGTLYIDDINIQNAITSLFTASGKYSWSDLFPPAISSLFMHWKSLFDATNDNPQGLTMLSQTIVLRKLATKTNYWGFSNLNFNNNINEDPDHPMFAVDNQNSYNWHVKPQSDGSYGNLIMDSPRIIELHAALNASQYLLETPAIIGTGTIDNPQTPATHKLDWYIKNSAGDKVTAIWKALGGDKFATYIEPATGNNVDRVSNLGWYIENIARVLGLRVDEKAYIDSSKEEDLYTRSILNDPQYDKNAYSKNSFGRFGRLTPNLTNSFGKKSVDKVADIPQLLEALFEHLNRSIGIQQGTEIEVLNSTTGKKDYYPNQFAMLLDIHAKITEIQLNSKENHNLLQVIAHEVRELFSGIGIPVSFKSLWGRYGKLLYIGHQNDKGSLLTSLTTIKINVGMLVGNLLVDRPRDNRNPLERIFSKRKGKSTKTKYPR